MKRVLLIAYHFPPLRGSSGMQRTLSLCKYLPENGYEPLLLTIHPRAYPEVAEDQLSRIPDSVPVVRAFGLDAARQLSVMGRYPGFLAFPERFSSWWLGGVPAGMRMIREYKPDLIWSTFPIATAHMIGHTLHRKSGLPWITDFRDPMIQENFPKKPSVRRVLKRVEVATVQRSSRCTLTARGAVEAYQRNYPELPKDHWVLIPNGYDEQVFPETLPEPEPMHDRPLKLLHAGLLYPNERDPRDFFEALGRLKRSGQLDASKLQVVLRASGSEDYYRKLLEDQDIGDIVDLAASQSYSQTLDEMCRADGLLIFQASNCNHQIPAKLYEYFKARRPILALTDPIGDTAATLDEAGAGLILRLSDADAMEQALPAFLDSIRDGSARLPSPEVVDAYSRRSLSAQTARLFDEVLADD